MQFMIGSVSDELVYEKLFVLIYDIYEMNIVKFFNGGWVFVDFDMGDFFNFVECFVQQLCM